MPLARDGTKKPAKYQVALDAGHDVTPLIAEVWGGMAPEAISFLHSLAQQRSDAPTLYRTWAADSFSAYWGQYVSLSIQRGVTQQLLSAAEAAAVRERKHEHERASAQQEC